MRDFVKAATKAADGPRNLKSQPSRPDTSRAKDVTKSNSNPMSIKAGLKKSQSRFKGNEANSKQGIGGSSAGLKNQSKATLKIDNQKKSKNDIKILETPPPPDNMIGRIRQSSVSQPVDYTRRGKHGNNNSIASLERRMNLNRMFR